MKKLLNFVLMMVCTVLMSIGLASCHDHRSSSDTDKTADSAKTSEIMSDPVFKTTDSFVIYIMKERSEAEMDSALFRLHERILASICDEVLHNNIELSKRTAYHQYRKNKVTYDYMNSRLITDPVPVSDTLEYKIKNKLETYGGHE